MGFPLAWKMFLYPRSAVTYLFVFLMPLTHFQGLWTPWNFLLGSIPIPTTRFWSQVWVLQSNLAVLYLWGQIPHRNAQSIFWNIATVGDLRNEAPWREWKVLRVIKSILRGCCHQLHAEWVVIPKGHCAHYRNPKDEDQTSHTSRKITRHLVKLKCKEI